MKNSGGRLGDVYNVSVEFKKLGLRITEEDWSGRLESNPYYQLGNLNFRSFIFNTYKIAQKKCTCMHCIPCMPCLICVSLGDVWGTVFSTVLLLCKVRIEPRRFSVDDEFIYWQHQDKCSKDRSPSGQIQGVAQGSQNPLSEGPFEREFQFVC
jgi:hypothetical protein